MASYTPNYQLHQWEGSDSFLRTDFNEDFKKIDTALGEVSIERIAHGSYLGDGERGRTIDLPFAPQVVILFGRILTSGAVSIITPQASCYVTDGCGINSQYNVKLMGDTLQIESFEWHNHSGATFYYTIIR